MLIKGLFVSASILAATVASSQEMMSADRTHGAVVTGVAIDSVHKIPLAGASISVSGTDLSSKTDFAGQFRIAGIPTGPHFLEIRHPLLDSLAIAITTRQRLFQDGDSAFVMVGVPSAASLVSSTCSVEDQASGPAFVVGTVTDAYSGKPSVGASVIVQWTDYDIGTKSVKATPKVRAATVSESGRFRVCGLPNDLVAAVFASRGSDSTAALKTDLSSLIGVLSFHLPPEKSSETKETSALPSAVSATVSGRVLTAEGKPAQGVTVSVDADKASALTDGEGKFTLSGVRPGTRWVALRKIGHEPRRVAAELRPAQVLAMDLVLGNAVTLLKEVIVNAERDAGLKSVGFAERKRYQTGDFMGPKELENEDRHNLMRVLANSIRLKRGGCTRYWVDGMMVMSGVKAQQYLGGAEIGAIEIYTEAYVPGEFLAMSPNGAPCRAVVVWTKGRLRI